MVKKKKNEKEKPEKPEKKEKEKEVSTAKSSINSKTKKKSSSVGSESASPLGKKFTCFNCSTKFYDLNKPEKVCPKCGSDQNSKPTQKQKFSKQNKFNEFDVVDEEITPIAEDEIILGEEAEEIEMEDEPILEEEDV